MRALGSMVERVPDKRSLMLRIKNEAQKLVSWVAGSAVERFPDKKEAQGSTPWRPTEEVDDPTITKVIAKVLE